MKEIFVEDKKSKIAYRGIVSDNDFNVPPFDYFRYSFALNLANVMRDNIRYQGRTLPQDSLLNNYALFRTDSLLSNMLSNSCPNKAIHELFTNEFLSYRQQVKLLKNCHLSASDNLWMNKEAQDLGYLLDIYTKQLYPDKFNEKEKPVLFVNNNDGLVDTFGNTNMTNGEMKYLLEQRKVVQARIYKKGDIWHCFYFTNKGLAGKESGNMGSCPHYHYLSSLSGISLEELKMRIKKCDMPSSKIHIVVDREILKK